jgi:hypothetical protein
MQRLVEDEKAKQLKEAKKKEEMYKIMLEMYQERERQRQIEDERDRAELEKLGEYQKKLDVRSFAQK